MCNTLALLRRDHRAAGLRNESYDPPFASAIELARLLPARRPGDLIVQKAPASSTALASGPSIDLRTLLTAAAIDTLSSIDVQDKSREPLAPPAATLDAQKSGSAATHAGSG